MTIPSFENINDATVQAALAEAAIHETGWILNDHYSSDFYCKRRINFLGKHEDFKHLTNGLLGIAAYDASKVFGDESEEDLSVQEVRRREIIHELVPFLPLPTMQNTESLNDFAGLPASEWAEGKEPMYPPRSDTPSRLSPLVAADGDVVAQSETDAESIGTNAPQRTKAARPAKLTGTASAYSSRGSRDPIKYPKGTKRPLTGPNETAEEVSTDTEGGYDSSASRDEAASPPPRKKLKIRGPRPAAATQQDPSAASGSRTGKGSTAPPRATASQSRASRIIAGLILPRSRAEAVEADEERYKKVLAQYNITQATRNEEALDEPDMMPEYFHTGNFAVGQESDSVRCVCGVVTDDGSQMVCCDDCQVWQHVACVGEAAPRSLKNGKYMCHNCDPYSHRRVIMGLRQANPIQDP